MSSKCLAAGLLVIVALSGCGGSVDRSGKMLTMAAEEAMFVDNLDMRLARQLNIADLQNKTNRKTDAAHTLQLAKDTLSSAEARKQLTEFRRIAGWTSISELARAADDKSLANAACNEALETLYSVKPEAARAEYVLSLSEEVKELRGNVEAGRLLVKGGEWAGTIPDKTVRRQALSAFANQLMMFDQFEEARTVLRNDSDAAWRVDVLTASAQNLNMEQTTRVTMSGAAMKSVTINNTYGKNVRFRDTFQQADFQQRMLPNEAPVQQRN